MREQETRAYMRHMVKQVELAKKLEKKYVVFYYLFRDTKYLLFLILNGIYLLTLFKLFYRHTSVHSNYTHI